MTDDETRDAPDLGYNEVAAMLGVEPSTLRKYNSEGRLPEPDKVVLDRPFWRRSTIQRWQAERPGRGHARWAEDPLDRKQFPGRPDHPDFWRLSSAVLSMDGATSEGGQTAAQVTGVDMDSLMYMAEQRIKLARGRLAGAGVDQAALAVVLYLDAFTLGLRYAESYTTNEEN